MSAFNRALAQIGTSLATKAINDKLQEKGIITPRKPIAVLQSKHPLKSTAIQGNLGTVASSMVLLGTAYLSTKGVDVSEETSTNVVLLSGALLNIGFAVYSIRGRYKATTPLRPLNSKNIFRN